VGGVGVLAPGSICSRFLKYVLNSLKCQKIPMKFFACRSRHSMFSQSCFLRKMIFFVLCVKKKYFDAKIGVARDIFLSFYTRHNKYRFIVKLGASTWHVKMYVLNFCSEFFSILKMFFPVMGACSHVPNQISDACVTSMYFYQELY
jgi:hypothetical protein